MLLTGGTGFFGKALLRQYLLSRDSFFSEIAVLTRNSEKFLSSFPEFSGHKSVTFLKGDIQQPSSLPSGRSFTHIVHAAADITNGPIITPLERYDQIVDGTRNILNLAVATGVKRFLYISSGAVYGSQPANLHAIPEDWIGSPPLEETSTVYGQAKRSAEHLCALVGKQHGFETVVARCFAFVGPDQPLDLHFAIGNFIRDALRGKAVTVSGDGSAQRTYLEQSDLANWLLTILINGRTGQAYNVGSDEIINITELACLVRDLLAPGIPVRTLSEPHHDIPRKRYVPDIRKAQRELGLNVTNSLVEAICKTANYHRNRRLS